jgi:hypothetical protein
VKLKSRLAVSVPTPAFKVVGHSIPTKESKRLQEEDEDLGDKAISCLSYAGCS